MTYRNQRKRKWIFIVSLVGFCTLQEANALRALDLSGVYSFEGKKPNALSAVSEAMNRQWGEAQKRVYVYSGGHPERSLFAPSGWMGDHGDIVLDVRNTEYPLNEASSIKVTYRAKAPQRAHWAAVMWQAITKGDNPAGYDLSRAKRLTFWARGARGGEVINEFRMGGLLGAYPDSDRVNDGPVVLSQTWRKYSLSLEGLDLSHIRGGFCWAVNQASNPNGMTFYLDEIRYEYD